MEIKIIDPKIDEKVWDAFRIVFPEEYASDQTGRYLFGAIDEEANVVGGMVFSMEVMSISIDWLYVVPEMRRQGVATALIDQLLDVNEGSLEFREIHAQFEEKQDDLKAFFEADERMDVEKDYDAYLITPEMRRKEGMFTSLSRGIGKADKFFEKSKAKQYTFLDNLRKNDRFYIKNEKEWRERCIDELCLCVEKDDEISSAILIFNADDNNLNLSYVLSGNPYSLLIVMGEAAKVIHEKYNDWNMIMAAVSDEAQALVDKIFPDKEVCNTYYTAEWNLL